MKMQRADQITSSNYLKLESTFLAEQMIVD